jgi:hypothetical protein
MLQSVANNGHTFEECKEVLKKSQLRLVNVFALLRGLFSSSFIDIKLDPGFKDFYRWCKANDIPVIIVSRSVFFSALPIITM